ncbi:MAG TPA: metallophosphoesterase [Chitinophagales bacterium]|nr:metallophosphoesterase [Chitinophagales bacterium]
MKHIYVISDLHIGGEPGSSATERGFQLNTHTAQLAAFIQLLAQQTQTHIELVINGDLVDFLAETPWRAFEKEIEVAIKKLQTIIGREKPFFNAISQFLQSKQHTVTLLLGNHDIELALPPLRRLLEEAMGATAANFRFLYDGEAYTIGNELIIEHGNRYDAWNSINEENLRLLREQFSRNEPWRTTFTPPKGSVLVERVMNPLKQTYRFIDLLKPETEAAIPILIALDPQVRTAIGEVLRIYANDFNWFKTPTTRNMGKAAIEPDDADELVEQQLKAVFGDSEADLQEFNQAMGFNPPDTDRGEVKTRSFFTKTLSLLQLLLPGNQSELTQRLPALIKSLKLLQQPHTFSLHTETLTEYYQAAAKLAGNGFKYIIFGHTHLAKQITLPNGSVYFNTGTWADLMTFPPQILQPDNNNHDPNLPATFLWHLAQNHLTPYIRFKPTFVHIELSPNGTVHNIALRQFDPVGNSFILPQDGI